MKDLIGRIKRVTDTLAVIEIRAPKKKFGARKSPSAQRISFCPEDKSLLARLKVGSRVRVHPGKKGSETVAKTVVVLEVTS